MAAILYFHLRFLEENLLTENLFIGILIKEMVVIPTINITRQIQLITGLPSVKRFDFVPSILFIHLVNFGYGAFSTDSSQYCSSFGNTNQVFYLVEITQFSTHKSGNSGSTRYSVSGTTVSWYNTGNSTMQLNDSNWKYAYIAIGE